MAASRPCEGQTALDLGTQERVPGQCQMEADTVRTGAHVMSWCRAWRSWTNCREVGHCTYAPTMTKEDMR